MVAIVSTALLINSFYYLYHKYVSTQKYGWYEGYVVDFQISKNLCTVKSTYTLVQSWILLLQQLLTSCIPKLCRFFKLFDANSNESNKQQKYEDKTTTMTTVRTQKIHRNQNKYTQQ